MESRSNYLCIDRSCGQYDQLSCRKEVEPDESVRKIDESKPQDDKLGFWESMKFLFTNKYYVLILVLYIVYYIMSNITTGSGVYFTKYVLGDASLLGMFQMMKMFPVIIALIFTPVLVKRPGACRRSISGDMRLTVC